MIFESGIIVGIKSTGKNGMIEKVNLEEGTVSVKIGNEIFNTVLDDITKHNKTVEGLNNSVYVRVKAEDYARLVRHNFKCPLEEHIQFEKVDTTTALFTSYTLNSLKENGNYFIDREFKDEEILDILDTVKQELEGDWIGEQLNELVDNEIQDAIKRTPLFNIKK